MSLIPFQLRLQRLLDSKRGFLERYVFTCVCVRVSVPVLCVCLFDARLKNEGKTGKDVLKED